MSLLIAISHVSDNIDIKGKNLKVRMGLDQQGLVTTLNIKSAAPIKLYQNKWGQLSAGHGHTNHMSKPHNNGNEDTIRRCAISHTNHKPLMQGR